MPFDPSKPADHSPLSSAEMREQLTSLDDEIAQRATSGDLATAIAETARNPSAITPLAITFSDPPTAAEAQAIVDFVNTMLAGLQR
jgi:hypothetical protein